MARQNIVLQTSSDAGITPAGIVGHVDGHAFDNDQRTCILLVNSGSGAHVVTVQTPQTVNGLAVADRTYTIPAGETRIAGPFRKTLYERTPLHTIWVDFDATPAEVLCSYVKTGVVA